IAMNEKTTPPNCTAFRSSRKVAGGSIFDVAAKLKELDANPNHTGILIFDDASSQQIELDLRGTEQEILQRLEALYGADTARDDAPTQTARAGRRKLGVVSREVTLLPRHWEWLNRQPGGASVALRKLVENAQRANAGKDAVRQWQDATYK